MYTGGGTSLITNGELSTVVDLIEDGEVRFDQQIDAEELVMMQQGFVGNNPDVDWFKIPAASIAIGNDVINYTKMLDDQIGIELSIDPHNTVIGRNVLAAYKMLVYHVTLNGNTLRTKLLMWRSVAITALAGCIILALTHHI